MENEKPTMLQLIYRKFKELKTQAEIDCTLDKTNLDTTGFNVTMNLSKWITYKTEWNRQFREFEEKRKKTYRKLYEFYDVESPRKLSTKTEYDLFIESDPGYVDDFNNSAVLKEGIQYIDSVIEILKNKQWEVKNWLEYQKFINGR